MNRHENRMIEAPVLPSKATQASLWHKKIALYPSPLRPSKPNFVENVRGCIVLNIYALDKIHRDLKERRSAVIAARRRSDQNLTESLGLNLDSRIFELIHRYRTATDH